MADRLTQVGRPAALAGAEALLESNEPSPSGAFDDLMRPVCSAFESPDLEPGHRIELARRIAKRIDGGCLLELIKPHVQDAGIRRELGLSLARHGWLGDGDIARLVNRQRTPPRAEDVAELVGDRLAVELMQQEFRLELPEVKTTQDVHKHLVTQLPPHRGLEARELSLLYANGVRIATRLHEEKNMHPADLQVALLNAYHPAGLRAALLNAYQPAEIGNVDIRDAAAVKQAAMKMDLQPPFDRLLERAASLPTYQRQALYSLVLTAGFALCRQEPATMDKLAPTIEWLATKWPLALRKALMRTFTDTVLMTGAEATLQYLGSKRFHRPHMKGFAVALHRLYPPGGAPFPESLHKVLAHTKLKDAKRLSKATHAVASIAETGSLSLAERRHLLEIAATGGGTKNDVLERFFTRLKRLALAVQILDIGPIDSAMHVKRSLQQVESEQGLDSVLHDLLRDLMPGSLGRGAPRRALDMEENLRCFMSESRQPEAFATYAQTLRYGETRASEDDQRKLAKLVDLVADAIVWSPDKHAAFARLRYDVQASPHLTHIAETAPVAWAAWCEELRTEVRVTGDRHAPLSIVDTDRAEDLLLCGTEVIGSCLAVDAEPYFNKGLLCFVADGKYRLLVAKDDDGRIAARRHLRLLCDETGQPVIHLERFYANPGIEADGAVDKALVDLAKNKAAALGCPLLCDGDLANTADMWPHKIRSMGSRAPYDYVDAQKIYLNNGTYVLPAWRQP